MTTNAERGVELPQEHPVIRVRFSEDERDSSCEISSSSFLPRFKFCSSWDSKSFSSKTHFVLKVSTITFLSLSFANLGLGISSWINGLRVNQLSSVSQLHLSGICQVSAAAVSCFWCIGLVISWLLGLSEKLISPKHLVYLIFGFLYAIGLNSTSALLAASFTTSEFNSTVVLGLQMSLTSGYQQSDVTRRDWDHIQTNHYCCGVSGHTDWLESEWTRRILEAKSLGTLDSNETTSVILPLSCQTDAGKKAPGCKTLRATRLNDINDRHLVVDDVTPVDHCDVDGGGERNSTFVLLYAHGCAVSYVDNLTYMLRYVMIMNLFFCFVEFGFAVLLIVLLRKREGRKSRSLSYQ